MNWGLPRAAHGDRMALLAGRAEFHGSLSLDCSG